MSELRCMRELLLGDWRDGEPSMKLELKDALVCILDDDVPDRVGIVDEDGMMRKCEC
jgi:hypothetical protein